MTDVHHQPAANMLAAAAMLASLGRAASNFQQKLVLGDLVLRDPLTGLLNHREFHQAVRAAADRAGLAMNFSVVLLDVDGFKAVNDDYGHAEGDRLLRDLAVLLAESVRAQDLVYRVGGDEFAFVLPGADASTAATVAHRVQADTNALRAGIGISYGSLTGRPTAR